MANPLAVATAQVKVIRLVPHFGFPLLLLERR
jgi:hypothetical protein